MIGFTGDGGSMYTIQALWTAARHNVAAKFVVCNNGSYRLLQLNIDQYWKEQGIAEARLPAELRPVVPAAALRRDGARAWACRACGSRQPEEIGPAIEQMLAHPGPFLIDLVLEGDTHPERVGNTCGQ